MYKNEVEAYITSTESLVSICMKFQKEAVDLYNEISSITKYPEKLPEAIQNYYNSKPKNYVDNLVGIYKSTDSNITDSIKVEYIDDQLYVNNNKAYFIKNDLIIEVFEFPTASLWKYNENTQEFINNTLMPSSIKRKKVND